MPDSEPDYNKSLLKISANLANARNTFGPDSPQYRTVLALLKECLREIDYKHAASGLDPETLSLAMGFLNLGT